MAEKEGEEGGNKEKKEKKESCTKGEVMQALRQKCNQLIFQGKNPTYHKGMHFYCLGICFCFCFVLFFHFISI